MDSAGGFGVSSLESNLEEAVPLIKHTGIPPIGYILDDIRPWAEQMRTVTDGQAKIWVQVDTVAEAVAVVEALDLDILVGQRSDAGGYRLAQSASIFTLINTDISLLTAGDIIDGRGMTAFLALGASGAVKMAHWYQNEQCRSTVHDRIRDIPSCPTRYDWRGIINQTYIDAVNGKKDDDRAFYENELKKGNSGWRPLPTHLTSTYH
ncbi:hypothetical protein BJX63DRAFT_443575 [Aspergillus granulosus]|uniref:Uncharacterized protein n=1 Tax=Aspergillus granulosus TaxID=176169 RepID=A0ABR4HZW2_9EURO